MFKKKNTKKFGWKPVSPYFCSKLNNKKMKKILLSALLIAAVSVSVNAQDDDQKLKFSVGVEAGLPIGDFSKSYGFGVGASAQADYKVGEKFAVTGSLGYLTFSAKSITIPAIVFGGVTISPASTVKGKAIGLIPVLVGGKYNFSEKLYGSGQLGLTFASGGGTGSSFTFAPGVGYNITENIDVMVKFVAYDKLNTIGLRAAYSF
jgi:opacity protein-like surface antigen